MTAAAAAIDFRACHTVAAVLDGLNGSGHRVVKAWPAGAAFEFLFRDEQWLIAAGADECAGALFIIERATSRHFGAVLTHDLVLVRAQQLAPFGVGVRDRILLLHG